MIPYVLKCGSSITSFYRSRVFLHFFTALLSCACILEANDDRTRLIIMADMGNETDEEQQMAHMLMYSNMFDLEGLIACSGLYLHSGVNSQFRSKTHPELFTKLINAYADVLENLEKHDDGWPSPDYLHSIVRSGTNVFGMKGVGKGQSDEASIFLEAAIVRDDPRKLYIVANAGTNTLAQALIDLDAKYSDAEMKQLCEKIIVFENGAQDNAGAWIASKYPHIAWHRSNRQTYCYGGPDNGNFGTALGPYTWSPYKRDSDGQDEWATEHIKQNHGPLGALFPYRNRFIEGGGTIPWMGLAFHGISDPERLYWGGQSGRFSREKQKNVMSRHPGIREDEKAYGEFYMFDSDTESESWTDPVENEAFSGREVPVWRFRRSMFNDFQGRMDWCVKDFDEANHNPVAAVNGDKSDNILFLNVEPGQVVDLDASASSDPDGDAVDLNWWVYREAGTYGKPIAIDNPTASKTALQIPADAGGKEIHVILEAKDQSEIIPMYDFRRLVMTVAEK
ncbi:MAG: nucleoside hydrolase-like domain-containing protein [Verrucomicrobiota bacterium]